MLSLFLLLFPTVQQTLPFEDEVVRPSFLIIRADQLRASALGAYGETSAVTPNLDQLASEGVRFTRAFSTSPVCSAYRTVFDTGKHPHANTNNNKLHANDRTIHSLLQAKGWYTFHIGKWHKTGCPPINFFPQTVPPCALVGLDYHAGHEQKHGLVGSVYYRNGSTASVGPVTWRPQSYVDEAIAQMQQFESNNEPFYGVLDLEPPHNPYSEINGTQWDIYATGDIPAPGNVPSGSVAVAEAQLANYYGMVYSVDDMVGQLMSYLASSGLGARTVVIFTSDHGSHLGAHGYTNQSNQKRTMYDESVRVPAIWWETTVEPYVESIPLGTVDWKPMIMERAGLAVPESLHGMRHPPGGLYFVQWSSGNTPDGAWRGVFRDDGMKYARSENSGPWILFDTVADPLELFNLIGLSDPREVEMDALLHQAATNVGETIPW